MDRKLSSYRIVTIIFGALLLLAFFLLPCYGGLANHSAFQIIMICFQSKTAVSYMGVIVAVLFGLPVLFSLVIVIFGIIGRKGGCIAIIACSSADLLTYAFQIVVIGFMGMAGYHISFLYYLVFALAGVPLAMAILELKRILDQQHAERAALENGQDGDLTVYEGNDKLLKPEGVIQCIKGEYMGATVRMRDRECITIGRSSVDSNLVLSDPTISRVHCRINFFADRGVYGVIDVSKHGVYDKNGRPLEKNQIIYLSSGEEIHIGKTNNVFLLK